MGTNYYVHPRGHDPIHLGKQSAGWQFTFRAYPGPLLPPPVTEPVTDSESWFRLLDLGNVYDEHGQIMTSIELLDVIERGIGSRNARGSADEYVDDSGARFIPGDFC